MPLIAADILALLCAIVGWFYLFYSQAAGRLISLEPSPRNLLRVRLRRTCGAVMFILGFTLYLGANTIDADHAPALFIGDWLVVMLLVFLIMILAWADLRLTSKLRRERRDS